MSHNLPMTATEVLKRNAEANIHHNRLIRELFVKPFSDRLMLILRKDYLWEPCS